MGYYWRPFGFDKSLVAYNGRFQFETKKRVNAVKSN